MASLPPGWSEQLDEAGRAYYVNPEGVSQWEPPSDPNAPATPEAQPAAHNPRRRQYAAAQADAYYGGDAPGGAGGVGYGQQPGADAAALLAAEGGGGLFTPGYGDQSGAPQGGQAPYYAPQGGAGTSSPYNQPAPNMAAVSNQFGAMGVAPNRNTGVDQGLRYPLNVVNVLGMQPDVKNIEAPPPAILLPPNASYTQSLNAIPDYSYMRSTLNAIPTTSSLLNKSKIPLALVLTPYRTVKEGDPAVPVVKDTVISRCRRCRAYIHPYVTFIEGGNRWKCPMCNLSNEVPQLFDWDQVANQPADRWKRSELNYSVVEFVAPTEYMVRPPQPPCFVFLIDVSQAAIASGMVATAARTILESLDRLPNDDGRSKISIIAVDSALHFFSLPPGATEASMLVVSDLDDVFLPKPMDLLVNIVESRAAIESLLGRLSDMFKDTYDNNHALGAALQAAYKLISVIGGKIIALTATLPNVGPGALKNREDPKLLGTTKESSLLQSQGSFYKNLAIDTSRSQVSVDMFLFSPTYTDVATLSCLPRYTAGQTYFYPSFNAAKSEDAIKFAHEFGEVLASRIAFEAVIRVRASRGLRMKAFHGNFFVRSTDLLSLPAVPENQSYTIEVELEDNLTTPWVVLQAGVLHTTCYGERRIRVITLALPTTDNMANMYASADAVAITTLLANKAVEKTMASKLEDARDSITNKMVELLVAFRTATQQGGSSAGSQLILPENLRHLPLLMLSLLKHIGIRESSQIPPDMRAYAQALLTTLPSQLLIPYLHPTFYALHVMPPDAGTIGEHGVIFPEPMNLTSERLERHGLFLIENGQEIFLWVGKEAVPQLVQDAFDYPSYAELPGGKTTLPILDNALSPRLNVLIAKIREMRRGPYRPHVYIVKEDGEPALRMWALSMLVEDRFDRTPSYSQYIATLREKVGSSG